MLNKINLGCGNIYLTEDGWTNYDYSPSHSSVQRANLFGPLPIQDESAELVYSSHFLEHIPYDLVQGFLSECYRILAPGGILRLVLPDLEELCQSYLLHRKNNEHDLAKVVLLEMIDQCVRRQSGGQLGQLYSRLGTLSSQNKKIIEFIHYRTGEDILASAQERSKSRNINFLRSMRTRLEQAWIRLVVSLLPKAFRSQNVSLAAVGERHHWLWDFHQLHKLLAETGFASIARCKADISSFVGFPFYPLDLDKTGAPRKGAESMYIEAQKR
jgi:predicted SAM-dependent methyltransferase